MREDGVNDREHYTFLVSKAKNIIARHKVPLRSSWRMIEDPNDPLRRTIIEVPLYSGYDSVLNLLKATISITFPPAGVGDRAVDVEVVDTYLPKATDPVSTEL